MRFPSIARRKGRLTYLLALLTAFVLTWPPASWGNDLAQVLSGRQHPLSVKLKDLGTGWSHAKITVSQGGTASLNIGVNVSGTSPALASQQNNNNNFNLFGGGQAYVTKGQTVSVNGESYLVAYHLPSSEMDLTTLLQAAATKTMPELQVLTPESSLSLALLNVRAIVSLEDVRGFDMKWEIAQSKEAAQKLINLLKAASEAGKAPQKPPAENPQRPEKK